MELLKKNIHMNKIRCKSNVQVTLDDDFNVPDIKPDIERIIKEQGNITIQDIKPMNGKLMVKGKLEFHLLYISNDNSRPVHTIHGELPFEEMVNMDEACGEDIVIAKWVIDDLSANLINSRKISVKSIITFIFQVEDAYDEETAVALEGDKNVYTQNKTIHVTQLAMNKKDTLRIKDEITMPTGKPNIFEILYDGLELRGIETRVLENKVNIKGDISVFLLYMGEDENQALQYYETEIPFSSSLDCNGLNEDMISNIGVSIHSKDMQIKPDNDGEERILDCEIVSELDMKIYEEEEIDIISDVYSTVKELIPVVKETDYENLLVKNNSKMRISDHVTLESGQPHILQICNVTGLINIDEQTIVPAGIALSGILEVQILYITENDDQPLDALKGSIPFEQIIEVKGIQEECIYEITPSIEQVSGILMDGENVEIKAAINLDAIVFEVKREPVIKEINVEDFNMEKLQSIPSIVGYIVKPNETLWNIAKRFYTTKESIMEVNELDSENVYAGEKLVLLKERQI